MRLLPEQHLGHGLESQRVEVQPVAGVEVGRYSLRIVVDDDGLVAHVANGAYRVDAAVVELDTLANPYGSRADDHNPLFQ